MVLAGMDVARLNFSHGDPATHRQVAANVREAAEATGRYIALMGDLQGPKIRTGALPSSFQRLARGRSVVMASTAAEHVVPGGEEEIHVSHHELVEALRAGDRVLLDDGRIELVVRSRSDGRAECTVVRGGLLGERKGISVPGRPLPMPALTEKDIQDLKLAVELGVDYLALSFVRRPEDVLACQEYLGALNCKVPIIAKLEKLEGIRNLSDILEVADAVMVARGDLGVELKLGEVPAVDDQVTALGGEPDDGVAPLRASGHMVQKVGVHVPRTVIHRGEPRARGFDDAGAGVVFAGFEHGPIDHQCRRRPLPVLGFGDADKDDAVGAEFTCDPVAHWTRRRYPQRGADWPWRPALSAMQHLDWPLVDIDHTAREQLPYLGEYGGEVGPRNRFASYGATGRVPGAHRHR